jgi:hypothetical protein
MASSDVVSFMKASSMVLSSLNLDCSGGNPRSGASGSNGGGARCRYPCGHHFWSRRWLEMVLLRGKPQIWVFRIGRWWRTTPLSLLEASFLEQTLARGGSQVEWHVAFRVNNGASRWLGAAEYRRRTWAEMRAQGGGVVWRHGGVIGRIGKVYADLDLQDCLEVRWRWWFM